MFSGGTFLPIYDFNKIVFSKTFCLNTVILKNNLSYVSLLA